jgi:dTDP-4-dehydrorhamnose 3,5-epimerase-like enzyme
MSSRFEVRDTAPGLHVIRRTPIGDHRGFLDGFCANELHTLEATAHPANLTRTVRRGTTRGMHFNTRLRK